MAAEGTGAIDGADEEEETESHFAQKARPTAKVTHGACLAETAEYLAVKVVTAEAGIQMVVGLETLRLDAVD